MPCGGKKKKEVFQKVIIPKGMVNPEETTIIEIPSKLQKQPVVVAKRKHQESSIAEKSAGGSDMDQHVQDDQPQIYCEPACAQRPQQFQPPPQQPYCDPVCAQRPASGQAPMPRPSPPRQQYYSPPPPPPPPQMSPTYSSYRTGGICPPLPGWQPQPQPQPQPQSQYGCQPQPVYHQQPQPMYQSPPQPSYHSQQFYSSTPAENNSRYRDPNEYNYPDPSVLAETELQELQMLKQDLEEFQRARRRLLVSTSNLAAKSKAVRLDPSGRPYPQQSTMPSAPPAMPPQQYYRPPPPQQYMMRPPPGPQIRVTPATPPPPQPKMITRTSTTKVYKAVPQKPQQRSADRVASTSADTSRKHDTCGCLDR